MQLITPPITIQPFPNPIAPFPSPVAPHPIVFVHGAIDKATLSLNNAVTQLLTLETPLETIRETTTKGLESIKGAISVAQGFAGADLLRMLTAAQTVATSALRNLEPIADAPIDTAHAVENLRSAVAYLATAKAMPSTHVPLPWE